MAPIPLSDEETRIIFGEEAGEGLDALDAPQQEQVLRKLLDVMEGAAPPSKYVYEQIGNLDIYRKGDMIRIYAKAVDNIPRGNTMYHVVYVFYIDEAHDYHRKHLAKFSPRAQQKLERITNLETVEDVEAYFERKNALDADLIREKIP